MNGKFIVIEGIEGAGKTSIIEQAVTKTLYYYGIKDIVFTSEPGSTLLAEKLRILLKNGIEGELITDKAELLMFYAARTQLIECIIKPALLRGAWVISDRYDLSSQAYQGGGRGINSQLLKTLFKIVLENFHPDLTFYLDVSPAIGLARVRNRGMLDRIESESLDFFNRVRLSYQKLAALDATIITIDANKSLKNVNSEVCNHLKQWLFTLNILK